MMYTSMTLLIKIGKKYTQQRIVYMIVHQHWKDKKKYLIYLFLLVIDKKPIKSFIDTSVSIKKCK